MRNNKKGVAYYIFINIPYWEELNQLINNKWVKSSAIWLVVTPIAAKSFKNIEEINLPFLENPINFSLPFSWIWFFFAALFFSVSTFLFIFYCPKSIKNYKNVSDFYQNDASNSLVKSLFFHDVPKTNFKGRSAENIEMYQDLWGVSVSAHRESSKEKFQVENILAKGQQECFAGLRVIFRDTHPFARFFITLFFTLGAICFFLVMFQNIQFVIAQI